MQISIIKYLEQNPESSSLEIFEGVNSDKSYATLKRELSKLIDDNYLEIVGRGKGTKYRISKIYNLIYPINIEEYFSKEADERIIKNQYNFQLINDVLSQVSIFTSQEFGTLEELQKLFLKKTESKDSIEYKKEMERLSIDLSWKSSQIEGNTYSLLETEELLKYKMTAAGKTKDEATMLLNHKDAIDFLITNNQYVTPLSTRSIEEIHSILIKELGIERNIRIRKVGISGTNYSPLDNEFQIIEALRDMCILINKKDSPFEKAILALLVISYIQPFADGNKRTARIISNAILLDNNYCPMSYRTVETLHYKKSMLLFYELNNLSAVKKMFMEQYEFAVKNYF